MKRPEAPSRDEWMDERVEAFVDGDLSRDEHATFVSILEDNPFWQTQVRQAEHIREGLHKLPEKPCPADVTKAIFEHTTRAPVHAPLPWWKDLLQQMVQAWRALMTAHRRPVVDYAVGLALVGMAAFFIINPLDNGTSRTATNVSSTLNTAPIQAPYSKAEIDRATQRAVQAFDQLSAAGRKAATTVQNQLRGATSPAATSPEASSPAATRPDSDAASDPASQATSDRTPEPKEGLTPQGTASASSGETSPQATPTPAKSTPATDQ